MPKRVQLFVTSLLLVGFAGACGPEQPPIDDDKCHMRMIACRNRCSKSGLDVACHVCCFSQAKKCDSGGDYSFYGCHGD
jgi:hypothetical protein